MQYDKLFNQMHGLTESAKGSVLSRVYGFVELHGSISEREFMNIVKKVVEENKKTHCCNSESK